MNLATNAIQAMRRVEPWPYCSSLSLRICAPRDGRNLDVGEYIRLK